MIRYLDLTKAYDGHIAVDKLTAEVPAGATVALLGPNGSGKTTTIKAAAGLIRPTSGAVLIGPAGRPAGDPDARQDCSFLPQRVGFPDAMQRNLGDKLTGDQINDIIAFLMTQK